MKFLGVLFAMLVLCFVTFFDRTAISSPSSRGWVEAFASASVGDDYSEASSGARAGDIKRGGYHLTCTGKPPKAAGFYGSTGVTHFKTLWDQRVHVSSSASIGGSFYGGGGDQDYDSAEAGP